MDIDKLVKFDVNGKTCVAVIRKLTERECGRLMDVDDNYIDIIQNSGVSRTSQYKMYGNSIVVNVLYNIFRKAFIPGQRDDESAFGGGLFDSFDEYEHPTYNHEHPLRVVTLCSGYDSQLLALERLKNDFPPFDYELVAWSEWDPESNKPTDEQPAVIAHKALFPQWADRNLGDMTKIDWNKVEDFDLLFYSTPCQSISQAGLQHGFVEGSGTRSSIIWNVRDALAIKKPRYACLENVAAMVSQKFLPMFNLWRNELNKLNYESFSQLINAKQMGVTQNRERIFLFSIHDENHTVQYHFPEPIQLKTLLKDLLEDTVDTKYYLNPVKAQEFVEKNLMKIIEYAKMDEGEIEPLPDNLRKWLEEYPDEPDEDESDSV